MNKLKILSESRELKIEKIVPFFPEKFNFFTVKTKIQFLAQFIALDLLIV